MAASGFTRAAAGSETEGPEGPGLTGRSALALGLLCGLAILARAIGLNSGLWLDEIWALVLAYREPLSAQLTVFQGDFHHTLYSVLARLSLVAFGESEWAIRLPALLFGAATIPLAFVLGRELYGPRDGWLAAILLTVFYPHVWFSQNARGYTMLAFWSTLATLLLVRHMRGGGRRPAWGYAIVLALGVYTHLTMVFLAGGHAAVCAVEALRARWGRARLVATGITYLAGAALTLVLYGPMLGQVATYFIDKPSQLVGVSTPLWAIAEAVRVLGQGLGAGPLVAATAAAGLFGLGAFSYLRRGPFVLGLFLVPAIVTVIGATLARGTMYPRFFFFMIVFLVLIMIRGTLVFGDWMGAKLMRRHALATRLGPAMVGLVVLASTAGLAYDYRYPKQDYEKAIAFVESAATGSDTIVTTGDGAWPLFQFYDRDYDLIETVEDLQRVRSGGGRTWMVYTFPLYIEAAAPEILRAIEEGCRDREVFPGTIGGGDLIVCSFPPIPDNG